MPSTVNQAYVFLATVYAGFIIGFIYDLFRMVRHIAKPGRFITAVLDLLFWLFMGALAYAVIYYVNYGEVRIYTIAGLAIGWALYALTLSPTIFKVLIFIYRAVYTALTWIIKLITWPFKLIARLLGYPLRFGKKAASGLFRRSKNLFSKISLKKKLKKNTG